MYVDSSTSRAKRKSTGSSMDYHAVKPSLSISTTRTSVLMRDL